MRSFNLSMSVACVLALSFFSAGCSEAAITEGSLFKGSTSTVYYLSSDGKRYVFPNGKTFESWYGDSGASVLQITDAEISKYPLAGNITVRPGVYLVKVQTDPKVYAVSAGGYLHWVSSESVARDLYGSDWNKKVIDIPDVFFVNYKIDSSIENSDQYNKEESMNYVKNIQTDLSAKNIYSSDKWLSANQKRVVFSLTNLFESGEVYPSYSIVENLDDGRGYTSGKSGFTTATGDAYLVVKEYTKLKPGNVLSGYLTKLKELSDGESGSISGLDGYADAWHRAALDPLFRQVQDQITEELYYLPAMETADELGVKTPLSKAFLYDTIIQHGGGDDEDGLYSMLDRVEERVGGTPADGIDERQWLKNFFDIRQQTLLNADNPDTREVWAESAYRVDAYRDLLDEDNLQLETPIRVNAGWVNELVR